MLILFTALFLWLEPTLGHSRPIRLLHRIRVEHFCTLSRTRRGGEEHGSTARTSTWASREMCERRSECCFGWRTMVQARNPSIHSPQVDARDNCEPMVRRIRAREGSSPPGSALHHG